MIPLGKAKSKVKYTDGTDADGDVDAAIVPYPDDEYVELTHPDFKISFPLTEENRYIFKRIGARARVQNRTDEEASEIVMATADLNSNAKQFYFGSEVIGQKYIAPKNFEILFEILKFLRYREGAFVFGVFCPKCNAPLFKKKCVCGYDPVKEKLDTICPKCGPGVVVKYDEMCPKCFTNTNIHRYMNIGSTDILKNELRTALRSNRPFHFFTGMSRLLHTFESKPLNLRNDRRFFGFDLALDIDAPNLKKAKSETKKVVKYLDKDLGIEPSIVFSGSKGYHIWLMYDCLVKNFNVERKEEYSQQEVTACLQEAGNTIVEESGCDYIDTAVLGGQRQLIRIPWTFHYKSGLVAYPMTVEEFEDFKPEMASVQNVLLKAEIRDKLKRMGMA